MSYSMAVRPAAERRTYFLGWRPSYTNTVSSSGVFIPTCAQSYYERVRSSEMTQRKTKATIPGHTQTDELSRLGQSSMRTTKRTGKATQTMQSYLMKFPRSHYRNMNLFVAGPVPRRPGSAYAWYAPETRPQMTQACGLFPASAHGLMINIPILPSPGNCAGMQLLAEKSGKSVTMPQSKTEAKQSIRARAHSFQHFFKTISICHKIRVIGLYCSLCLNRCALKCYMAIFMHRQLRILGRSSLQSGYEPHKGAGWSVPSRMYHYLRSVLTRRGVGAII